MQILSKTRRLPVYSATQTCEHQNAFWTRSELIRNALTPKCELVHELVQWRLSLHSRSTDHLPTTYRPPTDHLPTTFLRCSLFTITECVCFCLDFLWFGVFYSSCSSKVSNIARNRCWSTDFNGQCFDFRLVALVSILGCWSSIQVWQSQRHPVSGKFTFDLSTLIHLMGFLMKRDCIGVNAILSERVCCARTGNTRWTRFFCAHRKCILNACAVRAQEMCAELCVHRKCVLNSFVVRPQKCVSNCHFCKRPVSFIDRFHVTSLPPCWRTITKA